MRLSSIRTRTATTSLDLLGIQFTPRPCGGAFCVPVSRRSSFRCYWRGIRLPQDSLPHAMEPLMNRFAAPLFAAFLLVSPVTGAAMAEDPARIIETRGSASVAVTPDMATLRIGVERSEKTSSKAFSGATTAINDVIESMKAQGIAVKDIATSNLALNPVYDQNKTDNRGRPQIIGYSASVEISVISRDIAKVGALLDAALKDGSNQFNGIVFDVQDKTPALDEARKKAAERRSARPNFMRARFR